jgi:hypothetical protein
MRTHPREHEVDQLTVRALDGYRSLSGILVDPSYYILVLQRAWIAGHSI